MGSLKSFLTFLEETYQMIDGLSYAHEEGVFHMDFKFMQVLSIEDEDSNEPEPVVKIGDWGSSKSKSKNSLFSEDISCATRKFMDPELKHYTKSFNNFTSKSKLDVFSFGVSLLEIFDEKTDKYVSKYN